MYIFEQTIALKMPPEDFADFSPKHYKIEDFGEVSVDKTLRLYHITADSLKHLIEALVVLNYNDERQVYFSLKTIGMKEGKLGD